jgi:hypothetical protein
VLPNERIAQGTAALRDFDPVYVGVNTGGYWPAGAKSASPRGSDISAALGTSRLCHNPSAEKSTTDFQFPSPVWAGLAVTAAFTAPTILGSRIVKVEPRPGSLSTVISPPII